MFSKLLNTLSRLDADKLMFNAFNTQEAQERMLEEQRAQLLEGKASSGEDLRPYYSEDLKQNGGFFHSAESASRYASWKGGGKGKFKISYPTYPNATPMIERNPDAPNLFITGVFHNDVGFRLYANGMEWFPKTPYASNIFVKYNGEETFGLTERRMEFVKDEIIVPSLIGQIKKNINGENS